MFRQNIPAVSSHCTNTCLTVGDVGSAKYGKSMVANTGLRAAGDIRKVAKGHSTATNTAMNVTPPNSAHCQRGASLKNLHVTSSTNAGTISRIGNGSGTICVMFWYTGPSFGCAGNNGSTHIRIRTKAEYTPVMIVRAH